MQFDFIFRIVLRYADIMSSSDVDIDDEALNLSNSASDKWILC